MKTFNKKLMALIAVFAIIITTLVPTGFVKAVANPKLSINTVTAKKNQEETVTVKLTLENNSEGLRVLAGRIFYDKDKLEYVSSNIKGLENADSRRVAVHNETKGSVTLNASCSGLEVDAMKDNGEILEITFKVKANVSGEAEIRLAMDDVIGNEGTALEFTETSGAVKINIPTTGVNLNKSTLNLTAGTSEKLVATVVPEDATVQDLEWTSNNEKVATVSQDGTVTAVAEGNATITVKTVDGNYTKKCEVTVTCAHKNTKTHEAVASTCKEQGHAEYVTCEDCGKIISGSNEKLPFADHNYERVEKVEPVHTKTELAPGKEAHYKCSVCGKVFDENKKETTEEALVIKAPTHEYGEEWKSEADTTYHWKECGCGNMVKEDHKGGEATCTNKAICEVCGETYGEVNPANHKNTEVRNDKKATCTEAGYTGDTYCKDCDTKIAEGKEIAAGHRGGEATCKDKAICEVCGETYGEINPANHKNTEVRNAKEATVEAEGYTGDVYCKDCDTLVKAGETIAKVEEPKADDKKEDENKKEEVKKDPTKPQTDDNSQMMLYVSLFVISGISFVVIVKCTIKRKISKHSK